METSEEPFKKNHGTTSPLGMCIKVPTDDSFVLYFSLCLRTCGQLVSTRLLLECVFYPLD